MCIMRSNKKLIQWMPCLLLLLAGSMRRRALAAEGEPDRLNCKKKGIDSASCSAWSAAVGTWQGPIEAGGIEPQYAPTVYFGGMPDDPDDDEDPQPRFVGASDLEDLPREFDAREKWGERCPSIGTVWSQGKCGSCWAIATASAASDRHCIAGQAPDVELSPAQLIQCCQNAQNGCEKSVGCSGGYLKESYAFWRDAGFVTGDSGNKGCLPYLDDFRQAEGPQRGSCPVRCYKSRHKLSSQPRYHATQVGLIPANELMREIFESGPVASRMAAHPEFACCYSSGVYQNATEQPESNHVVKLIGWGTDESGIDFWLAVNSWGLDWGENGLFRIRRGVDFVGIESHAYRGWFDDSVKTNAEDTAETSKELAGTLSEPSTDASVFEDTTHDESEPRGNEALSMTQRPSGNAIHSGSYCLPPLWRTCPGKLLGRIQKDRTYSRADCTTRGRCLTFTNGYVCADFDPSPTSYPVDRQAPLLVDYYCVEFNGTHVIETDEVVLNCNAGFSLRGASKLTCGSDGKWSATWPKCVAEAKQL